MVFTFHACKTAPRLGRWPTLQKIRAGRFYRHSFDGTHRPRWVRTGLMRRLIISLLRAESYLLPGEWIVGGRQRAVRDFQRLGASL
jgi:hypothetical protein